MFTTSIKDANNFIMKAFWNKICRIFDKKNTDMSSQKNKSGGLRKAVWKIITGNTETELVSDSAAEILSDKKLSGEFARSLSKPTNKVVRGNSGKIYTFKTVKG